jgi:hypothetical protein
MTFDKWYDIHRSELGNKRSAKSVYYKAMLARQSTLNRQDIADIFSETSSYLKALKEIAQVEREESDMMLALNKIRDILEEALKEAP